MNKTVNINLANIFFHIDETAYTKLQRYLQAIKRSFANTKGSDEILADIESRIAELFQESVEHERQVITEKEVDRVINIMGQPEDYLVDEEVFQDVPPKQGQVNVKKLYRDTDTKYIGGVCSGLGHYLKLDAIWVRIIFIVLALASGFGIVGYILLWILVPEATTTAQKLDMRGEEVNISNIERKVKEGFDSVADTVKNVDYEKMGNKVKSSTRSFFDSIGDLFMFIFKVFAKLFGIILILVGSATLVGLVIGMFTVGIMDIVHLPGINLFQYVNATEIPLWAVSILAFLAIGIPFFFLLYLGLNILVSNLKSIGNVAKFTLLGLWIFSVVALTVLGIKQATAHAYSGSVVNEAVLEPLTVQDTLIIATQATELVGDWDQNDFNGIHVAYAEDGERLLYSRDVRINFGTSADSLVRIKVRKDAEGSSVMNARNRAAQIEYDYTVMGNTLLLDNFLTSLARNKIRDQEVHVTLLIPEGKRLAFDKNTEYQLGWNIRNDRNYGRSKLVSHQWRMGAEGQLLCTDCGGIDTGDSPGIKIREGDGHIIIDENGIDIDIQEDGESFKLKINEDGIKMNAEEQ